MPEVKSVEKLLSVVPRKRFGVFRKLGTFQLGFSSLGDDDIWFDPVGLGNMIFGVNKMGDAILLSGIYRTDNVTGQTRYYREPYYITKNPRYVDQQANRQKYADGVAAWQALTQEQKNVYNERARFKPYSGYNLFLKEYLLSH